MSLFSELSNKSRKKKIKLFYELTNPQPDSLILDVGAEINPDGNRGLQLIDSYENKHNISCINLSEDHIQKIKDIYTQIDAKVANACDLPYPDKYFDIVYCNAVIEHVGDFEQQRKMASEIMRVGKSWFVTTPNRWYPFEFHLRLPFITWLPFHGYRKVGGFFGYNHVKMKYVFGKVDTNLWLLGSKELAKLFDKSTIIKSRITFMPETLIAFGRGE